MPGLTLASKSSRYFMALYSSERGKAKHQPAKLINESEFLGLYAILRVTVQCTCRHMHGPHDNLHKCSTAADGANKNMYCGTAMVTTLDWCMRWMGNDGIM